MPVQIRQAMQHALGDLTQHLFARPAAQPLHLPVNGVEGTALAILHDNGCRAMEVEGAVVLANVLRRALLVEREFAQDLLLHVWVRIGRDDLSESVDVWSANFGSFLHSPTK